MASLFNTPRPRGQKQGGLLDSGFEVGATDLLFQQMGRAPVDELFAGRNSAAIQDAGWDARENRARGALQTARGQHSGDEGKKPWEMDWSGNWRDKATPVLDPTEGGADDRRVRNAVTDATGLMMYPGDGVKSDVDDVVFMQEFDDSGATLVDGWRDGNATKLSDILNHELLYKHYPELADLPLDASDLGQRRLGSYGGVSSEHPLGTMRINNRLPDQRLMDTLLHETQHYIQKLEGWPGGGGHGAKTNKNFASWHPGASEKNDAAVAKTNPFVGDERAVAEDHRKHQAYENISGEILARDVMHRNNMRGTIRTAEDALANNPSSIGGPKERYELRNRIVNAKEHMPYYPAMRRDESNSYPHDMPVQHAPEQPWVQKNAMARRHQNYGVQDQDTINAFTSADGLLEEAMREFNARQKRQGK